MRIDEPTTRVRRHQVHGLRPEHPREVLVPRGLQLIHGGRLGPVGHLEGELSLLVRLESLGLLRRGHATVGEPERRVQAVERVRAQIEGQTLVEHRVEELLAVWLGVRVQELHVQTNRTPVDLVRGDAELPVQRVLDSLLQAADVDALPPGTHDRLGLQEVLVRLGAREVQQVVLLSVCDRRAAVGQAHSAGEAPVELHDRHHLVHTVGAHLCDMHRHLVGLRLRIRHQVRAGQLNRGDRLLRREHVGALRRQGLRGLRDRAGPGHGDRGPGRRRQDALAGLDGHARNLVRPVAQALRVEDRPEDAPLQLAGTGRRRRVGLLMDLGGCLHERGLRVQQRLHQVGVACVPVAQRRVLVEVHAAQVVLRELRDLQSRHVPSDRGRHVGDASSDHRTGQHVPRVLRQVGNLVRVQRQGPGQLVQLLERTRHLLQDRPVRLDDVRDRGRRVCDIRRVVPVDVELLDHRAEAVALQELLGSPGELLEARLHRGRGCLRLLGRHGCRVDATQQFLLLRLDQLVQQLLREVGLHLVLAQAQELAQPVRAGSVHHLLQDGRQHRSVGLAGLQLLGADLAHQTEDVHHVPVRPGRSTLRLVDGQRVLHGGVLGDQHVVQRIREGEHLAVSPGHRLHHGCVDRAGACIVTQHLLVRAAVDEFRQGLADEELLGEVAGRVHVHHRREQDRPQQRPGLAVLRPQSQQRLRAG